MDSYVIFTLNNYGKENVFIFIWASLTFFEISDAHEWEN